MPRMSSRPLTAKGIENARPPKDRDFVEHPDAAMPGLCMRAYRSGAKSFILTTRVNGRLKRRKIGDAAGPLAIPLAEARRLAGDAKDMAKIGRALPRYEAPTTPSEAMTFGTVAEDYIARECPRLARGDEIAALIRRELLPAWRFVVLPDLRKRHARELTDALARSKPAAAVKLHETYRRVLNWALAFYDDDDLGIEVSPFANLAPPVSKVARGRALGEAEIRTLWRVWTSVGYPFGDLQKLLLLTAQRRSEVASMTWDEIDMKGRVWTIPASRSKSRREHAVPLSDAAMEILDALPRFAANERTGAGRFAFSTSGGRLAVSGFSRAKAVADKMADALAATGDHAPVAEWRWHDLRRTARSGLAALGVPEIVSERVLNHAPRGLAGVYNVFDYRQEKADALQRWGRRVIEIVTPPPANVLAMESRKTGAA